MKIALVAHGRFHAFDLARELLARGHDVNLFTNYPGWAVRAFGVPTSRVRSFAVHGVVSRSIAKLGVPTGAGPGEAWLHEWFGRWACRELAKQSWDVIHVWSGVAEETLRERSESASMLLMRGSAHIRTQDRLLREEEERTGTKQIRPSSWMIAREEREYARADTIVVLSRFARNTFIAEGTPAERLLHLPLGADLRTFRPPLTAVRERQQRILSGAPLRVLYVGALSFQKGLADLATAVEKLGTKNYRFQLVGPCAAEARPVLGSLRRRVTLTPKLAQSSLPDIYAAADVFLFPTIHDGYAIVLAQAAAAALPILTTTNCAGPELISDDQNGWVVPIRSPEKLVERLRWCADNRWALAEMVERSYGWFQPRDWADVAADFEALCSGRMALVS